MSYYPCWSRFDTPLLKSVVFGILHLCMFRPTRPLMTLKPHLTALFSSSVTRNAVYMEVKSQALARLGHQKLLLYSTRSLLHSQCCEAMFPWCRTATRVASPAPLWASFVVTIILQMIDHNTSPRRFAYERNTKDSKAALCRWAMELRPSQCPLSRRRGRL